MVGRQKLGKNKATISKWITNTTQPNLETLMHIAKVLGTQVDDLLQFEELPEIDTSAVKPLIVYTNKNLWRMKQLYETYMLGDVKLSILLERIGNT